MMHVEYSPATDSRVPPPARGGVSPRHGSPITFDAAAPAPKTPEDAARLLARVERLLGFGQAAPELLTFLTNFLGANSAAWTPSNRARLRRAIVEFGPRSLDAVVSFIQTKPRTDVLDEAELVLRAIATDATQIGPYLSDARLRAVVRACLLRAAARARIGGFAPLLATSLKSPVQEIREAAAEMLGESELPLARQLLELRLRSERNSVVRDAIENAISEFG